MAFDIKKVNGLGDGSLGDVTITSASTQINSYAGVTAISSDGKTVTINMNNASIGAYGGFVVGQEVMFHVTGCLGTGTADLGKYGFAKILSVGVNQLVLDAAVPIVDMTAYVYQIVTVPNFNNLTVKCAVSALAYDINKKYGGIIAVKVKGILDLTSGSILAEKKGLPDLPSSPVLKPAGITTTNADLINRLLMSTGNGIVVLIANQLKLTSSSRLGASWTGAGGPGNPIGMTSGSYPYPCSDFYSGGAGYGGGGGGGSSTVGSPGNGSSGGDGGAGGNVSDVAKGIGGKIGYSGISSNVTYYNDHYGIYPNGGPGGAVIFLIINTISGFYIDTFSTGGGNGYDNWGSGGGGGGGAGYGYIATNTASFPTNTIAYALDNTLEIDKKAFIESKKSLDCSKFTSVDGFTFAGNQPAETDRKLIFSLGATKVAGSRTFPITTNAVAGDTVTIAGATITAVASTATPAANQFCIGSTVAATATNIAAALNLNATFKAIYAANADNSGVITVSENSGHTGYGNTPAAATKTGTIVIGAGITTASVPTWFKLTVASGVASMVAVATQTPTLDSVLSEGNAIADLTGITSIPAFIGQQIYIAEALIAPFDATVLPALSVTLNGHNNQDQYQHDEESAEYTLANSDVDIVSVTADSTITGQATAAVMVSLKQAGTWSGYMTMIDAKGKKASAIKYKATYTVTKLDGTDSAKVNKVSVIYCAGTSTVSGDTAEILTITQDYENGLSFAQCLVKHKALMDAQIKAFVSFRSAPKKRIMVAVGTGNGQTQTVKLGAKDGQGNFVPDTGINHNTLSVQYDGKPVFDYGYNTETSELTFIAANGVAVTANYEYGWEQENWLEMVAQDFQLYNDSGMYGTKFTYTLPSGTTDKTISDIKIQLYRPSGHVDNASLGNATGQRQLFVLPHYAKKETIVCNGSWSYDDSSRILTVVADKDTPLVIGYDWIAETQEVYGLTAGWAE